MTEVTEPVLSVRTPIRLEYEFTAGRAQTRFLEAVAQKRLMGQRCPSCRKVYVPPRGSCPTCGVPTDEEVELEHRGTVTTFCVVNVPFLGQTVEIPYVTAQVLLDGADIAFMHLIQEIPADKVRMGLRVEAVWVPDEDLDRSLTSIRYFRPTGEPDAEYDTYKGYL